MNNMSQKDCIRQFQTLSFSVYCGTSNIKNIKPKYSNKSLFDCVRLENELHLMCHTNPIYLLSTS